MTEAEQEAVRRYPDSKSIEVGQDRISRLHFILRSDNRDAFIAGANWQAQRPVQVSDDRLLLGFLRLTNPDPALDPLQRFRAAVEEVLRGHNDRS